MIRNKIYLYVLLLVTVILSSSLLLGKNITIRANSSDQKLKVLLTKYYVPDIDNVLYPSTSQFYMLDSTGGVGEFKINEPTIIKGYFNWDKTMNVKLSGTAWFSRDKEGLDTVGESIKLSKPGDSILTFLDPGTYYLHYYITLKNSTSSKNTMDKIKFGVAILAENVKSEENIFSSSYTMPNQLKFGESKRGFLSTTSPMDFYRISVKEYSEVMITYNFEKTDDIDLSKAICTLYDKDNQKITSKIFNSAGEGKNTITQMLEQGTYYISLSGATCTTSVKAEAISYVVNTKLNTNKWTNKDIQVLIVHEFESIEELLVNGKVQDSKINDSKIWRVNKGECSEINNSSFIATKNGVYSIRVKDKNKNYILKRIKVSNIDKLPPSISGVTNGSTYKNKVKIKYWDRGGSGIKYALLNNEKIENKTTLSKKGTHTLKVADYAGNIKILTFKID